MREIVLYHANCNDGFCAAWLWKLVYPEADIRAVRYGQSFPWNLLHSYESVVILDFSWPRDILDKVAVGTAGRGGRLLIVDHHKTAAADLKNYPYAFFDLTKSGARLTYEYLESLGNNLSYSRWLVDYTEDRDLWKWKLADTREVSAALSSYPRDLDVWTAIRDRKWQVGEMMKFVREGAAILRYQKRVIESMTKAGKVNFVDIGGYEVPAVNVSDPFLISEIVGKLAEDYSDHSFAAGYFVAGRTREVQYSLRSRGGFDVSEVAKSFGGGGHPPAAGFRTDHVIGMDLS